MKVGLTISAIGHATLFLCGLVTFSAKPFDAGYSESLPVDLVSASEYSQLMAGSKTAPKAQTPKPVVEKIAESKPAKEPTPKVSEKPEIVTASAEPTPPIAQPKPPEPKPEQRKEPDPKLDPIAEALKTDEAKKQEPKPQAQAPPKKPPPPQPKFDPLRIENRLALIDRRTPQRQAAAGDVLNQTASLGVATGTASALSQNEIDALRAQIQACWNPPAGAVEAKELIVKVRLLLNQDGSLSGEPILLNQGGSPFFQVAAESAMRAIRRCQPYKLPIAKYDVWKDVEVTFDPREMFRG